MPLEVSKARKSLTHDDEVVIARRAIEEGQDLVVVVNKMDLVEERLYDQVVKVSLKKSKQSSPRLVNRSKLKSNVIYIYILPIIY
ncbi:putative P-loop containing nucleoside triphosphate hydrolase [Helianthus debilis subsp. tardiflorus]